jgi:hypothetical protein
MMSDQPSPRRRFQFRLRVLLVPLVLAVAAVGYFFVWPAIRDREAREDVHERLQKIGDALKRYEAQHQQAKKD